MLLIVVLDSSLVMVLHFTFWNPGISANHILTNLVFSLLSEMPHPPNGGIEFKGMKKIEPDETIDRSSTIDNEGQGCQLFKH